MKKLFVSLAILATSAFAFGGDLSSLLLPVSEMKDSAKDSVPRQQEGAKAPDAAPTPQPIVYAYIGQDELIDNLREALISKFMPDGKLVVEAVIPWKAIQISASNWKVEITRISAQSILPRMTVNFRIVCDKAAIGEYQIQLNCSIMREVLVSMRRYNRAESVSSDDFQIQTRDILDLSGVPTRTTDSLDGMQTRGPISEGQVLCTRDIEEKPLIRRGQVVEAIAIEGKMRIAVKATAMEDGREGDLISVRNTSSNKDIQAKILNDHTVQVYF
jgi:flagellar basal body P-ring formation protein FlgA